MWNGRMMLAGRLWVPRDPDPAFFAPTVGAFGDRWFTANPVGAITAMAITDRIGAQWLVGPISSGVAVFAFYRFARSAYGERVARGTTVVLCLAGFLIMMGATRMTHNESMMLIMIALAALATWTTAETRPAAYTSAAIIGFSVAANVAVRPYDAALSAIVIGAFQLTALRGATWRPRSLVVQLLAGLVPLAIVFAVNVNITGHPLEFGYQAINGSEHDPGFHVSPHGVEHTPLRGLMLASSYLLLMNRALLYGPIPALLLIAAGLLALRRVTRWDALVYAIDRRLLRGIRRVLVRW